MAVLSLFALLGLSLFPQAVVSVPQASPTVENPGLVITAQSQGLGAPTASVTNCGGCLLVADVAGIIWYSEVFQLAAATIVNAIYVANQTSSSGRVVATSRRTITAGGGQVTIRPNSLGGGPELQVQYAPTLVIANATLVSPTPYNVFTAYTLTTTFISDNKCVESVYDKVSLENAFTQVLSSATGVVYVNADQEQNFISSLGLTCSPGSLNLANTALIQVSTFTTTVDSIGTTLQLLAASRTLAPTTGATELAAEPASTLSLNVAIQTATATIRTVGTASSTAAPSAHAPLIIVGATTTLTPVANPINLPFYVPPTAIPTLTQVENPAGGGSNILVVIPSGTSSGAGNYTATIVPYASEADGLRKSHLWMSLWVFGLFGLGVILVL